MSLAALFVALGTNIAASIDVKIVATHFEPWCSILHNFKHVSEQYIFDNLHSYHTINMHMDLMEAYPFGICMHLMQ